MRKIISTFASGLLIVLFFSCNSTETKNQSETKAETSSEELKISSPTKEMIASEEKRQKDSLPSLTLNVVTQNQEVCAGSPIPSGWIITGGRWCPSCCGGTTGGIYNNVLTITRYDNLPQGTVLEVCAGQTTPNGWAIVGGRWCPSCCGGTTGGIYNNVIQIKRIN